MNTLKAFQKQTTLGLPPATLIYFEGRREIRNCSPLRRGFEEKDASVPGFAEGDFMNLVRNRITKGLNSDLTLYLHFIFWALLKWPFSFLF